MKSMTLFLHFPFLEEELFYLLILFFHFGVDLSLPIVRFGELKAALEGFVEFVGGLVFAIVLGDITLKEGMLALELFKELELAVFDLEEILPD